MVLGIIKKVPNYIMLISLLISTFLLSFLLVGCIGTSDAYSSIYLIKLGFNESSDVYSNVRDAYEDNNSTSDLSKMSIRVGYLSTCVHFNDALTCTSYSNLNQLSSYSGVELFGSSDDSATQLDLVQISRAFSEACYSNVLMAAIVVTLILLLLSAYGAVPLLPGKSMARKISCLLAVGNILLWGLGCMLQHEAVITAHRTIGLASMSVVSASIGGKAEAMTWTAFAFLMIVAISNVVLCARDIATRAKEKQSMKF